MPMILAAHEWVSPLIEVIKSLGLGAVLGTVVGAVLTRKSTARLDRQRRRLEKEYEIYGKLWETLFELRRTIGSIGSLEGAIPMQEIAAAFNGYQAVVRRNEPFICPSVYEPARETLRLARSIVGKHRHSENLEHERKGMNSEGVADRQCQLDDEIAEALDKIEELMNAVLAAIRRRIWD